MLAKFLSLYGLWYLLQPHSSLNFGDYFSLFVGDNSDKIIISGSIYLRHGFFHPRI